MRHSAEMLLAMAFVSGLATGADGQQATTSDSSGSRWAILIGVNDYNELGKLRFAVADQLALARQLTASGFPEDQVFLLHDNATENKYRPVRENIEKQMDLVLNMVRPKDLIILGFSGHGVQLANKSYLCPSDARLDKLESTLISMDDVYGRLAGCPASLKLLLVDACRNDVVPAGRRSLGGSRSLGEFTAVAAPPQGILLLASCGAGQVSLEDEQFGHGVFMHYLLEGLQGKAANPLGSVSLAGLYDYASLQTSKYVARRFNEYQTPALKGDINGPFEICRIARPEPLIHEPVRPEPPRMVPNAEQPTPEPEFVAGEEISLFDGKTLNGWRGLGGAPLPEGCSVDQGNLRMAGRKTYILTEQSFASFDLRLLWCVTARGNGGVIHRAVENSDRQYPKGLEMQLADDDSTANDPVSRSGATWDLYGPGSRVSNPAGEWNEARLLVRGDHVEQWLNGAKVADFIRNSEETRGRFERSHYTSSTGTTWEDVQQPRGPIALQCWDGVIWYRDLRIRPLAER